MERSPGGKGSWERSPHRRARERREFRGTVLAVVREESEVRPWTRHRLDSVRVGDAAVHANEVDASLQPVPPCEGEHRIEPVPGEPLQPADAVPPPGIDHRPGPPTPDERGALQLERRT